MGARGPKKGTKRAVAPKQEVSAVVETPTEDKSSMQGSPFVAPEDTDRAELYKRYLASDGDEITDEIKEMTAEAEPAEDVSAEPAVEEEAKLVPQDDVEPAQVNEQEATQEAEPEKPAKEAKEAKTVPLQALHEERERRKQLAKELNDMKERQAIYERQMAYYQAQAQPQVDDSELTDYDKALLRLNQQNQQLAQQQEAIARAIDADRQTRELQAISQNIQHTSVELEKEGFPHFYEMQDMVVSELKRLYADDPENIYEYPDNPLGWSKAYKEVVYPKLQRFGGGMARSESFEAKKALKSKAGLSGSTGKGSVPQVDTNKKALSYEDMLKNYRSVRGY